MTPYEAWKKANIDEVDAVFYSGPGGGYYKMTPEQAYYKAIRAGKRLIELEDMVLTDAFWAYIYAENIIKSRWIEAEDVIMTDSSPCFAYAEYVTKGKLPEKMHNMMILHAIKDPNDYYVKKYFEFIK